MHRPATVLTRALVAAVAAAALLAPAAPAREPEPGFEEFYGCPAPPVLIDHCVVSTLSPLELQLGGLRLVVDPVVQNGGVPPGFPAPFVYNERGGHFAPKVPLELDRRHGLRDLTADVELAGTVISSLPFGAQIPIKIALEGPELEPGCYIGSEAHPIVLDLTTGETAPPPPNEPMTGTPPAFGPHPADPRKQVVTDGVLVDNALAAPGAKGCTWRSPALLASERSADDAINRAAGLPSPPGTNAAVVAFGAVVAKQFFVYSPLVL